MDFKLLVRRFLAFVIDWNIMFAGVWAIAVFGSGINTEYLMYPGFKMFSSHGILLGILMGILWMILYGLFKDCVFCGRSLGKMICGGTL